MKNPLSESLFLKHTRRPTHVVVFIALLLSLAITACGDDIDDDYRGENEIDPDTFDPGGECWETSIQDYVMPPDDDDRPWILVDLLHTDIQTPTDHCLDRDQYNYQGAYGFFRLFSHYRDHGYPWAPTTLELSAPRLEPYDILFINLVHERNPDFTDDEVDAILEFVENGGGLFVIGDHTNVYRHAERVNRFLEPMGIEMMYHTTVDYPPFYSVAGLGWIMMFDFADHPINDDVEMISFKTGGPVASEDPSDDLAFTSEQSFADYWDEDNDFGFYGSWSQGDDEELEPSGPLSVATATEYGEGRAVLVGDQNIFGDGWLHLGHNFEFATNIIEWLAGNEDTEEPLRHQPIEGHNVIFESDVNFYQMARTHNDGYYNIFIETNRNEGITGRALPGVATHGVDTLFFPASDIEFGEDELDDRSYSEDDLTRTKHLLEDGGQVVVSFDPTDITEPTEQLLEALTDDFSVQIGDHIWSPGDEDPPQAPESVSGFHHVTSPAFDIDGLYLGALHAGSFPPYSDEERQARKEELKEIRDVDDLSLEDEDIYRGLYDEYQPEDFVEGASREDAGAHLYDVDVSWGEPFIEAELPGGETTTIARRKLVEHGELIIFVQDGFFRNRTLGTDELLEPKSFFRKDIVEFHHRLLDYLRGQ